MQIYEISFDSRWESPPLKSFWSPSEPISSHEDGLVISIQATATWKMFEEKKKKQLKDLSCGLNGWEMQKKVFHVSEEIGDIGQGV